MGLTLRELALRLGYGGSDPTQWLSVIELELKPGRHLTYAQANLLLAMAEGYEPVWEVEPSPAPSRR